MGGAVTLNLGHAREALLLVRGEVVRTQLDVRRREDGARVVELRNGSGRESAAGVVDGAMSAMRELLLGALICARYPAGASTKPELWRPCSSAMSSARPTSPRITNHLRRSEFHLSRGRASFFKQRLPRSRF